MPVVVSLRLLLYPSMDQAKDFELTPPDDFSVSVYYLLVSGSTGLPPVDWVDCTTADMGGVRAYIEMLIGQDRKCKRRREKQISFVPFVPKLSLVVTRVTEAGDHVNTVRSWASVKKFMREFEPLCVLGAPASWATLESDKLYPVYMNTRACNKSHVDDGVCDCVGTGCVKNDPAVVGCVQVLIPALRKMQRVRRDAAQKKPAASLPPDHEVCMCGCHGNSRMVHF
jgi:hypothetical protein